MAGLALAALLFAGAATGVQAKPKQLSFAGLIWNIRPDSLSDPGPNHWSSSNAWVDDNGRLHLKLSKVDGVWYAVELATVEHLGFGTYQFWLDTPVNAYDPNVVFAMFNYPAKQGLDGTNEIDVEFGKWGVPDAPELDYVIYPSKPGPEPGGYAFHVTDPSAENTQRFTWTSRTVDFQALAGHQNGNRRQYLHWAYKPKPGARKLVPQVPMPVHLNLWLNGGFAPIDGKEVEVVVSNFTFTPAAP